MRYLAWFLLVANLGVLVWIINQPAQQPPEYRPLPVPPGVEPLLLLSERGPKPEIDENIQQARQEPVSSDQVAVDERRAVSEVETSDEDEDLKSSVVAEVKPEVQLICQTVGPMNIETDALNLAALLTGHGYAPRTRTAEVREPSGYWVYMPAMAASKARQIVAELDANGMTDYFIGKQNYISLGIFTRREKAQSRLDQVEALGFDAILDRRYRTHNVYWLDIEEPRQPLLGSELWTEIQAQYADIRVHHVSCD